jgi:hypothetical protein
MPHYVKKLWEKNYWHESLCERVFVPKTMTVIFLERWQRSGIWNVKLPFTTERKSIVVRNEIIEMKQTKMRV